MIARLVHERVRPAVTRAVWEGAMLTKLIKYAYARRHPPKTAAEIRAEVVAEHEEIGREVAARFARGNVNIKAGRFFTRRDLTHNGITSKSD